MAIHRDNFFSGVGWLIIAVLVVLLALSVRYFSGSSGDIATNSITPSATPHLTREYTVFYKAGVFGPTNLLIHEGDSVKFENDSFSPLHVVSAVVDGKPQLSDLDSGGDISSNGSYTYTFLQAGIFGYQNMHNSTESGSVTVRP